MLRQNIMIDQRKNPALQLFLTHSTVSRVWDMETVNQMVRMVVRKGNVHRTETTVHIMTDHRNL